MLYLRICISPGSHDIAEAIVRETETAEVNVITQYFKNTSASGALYVLVYVTEDEEVDFNRSVVQALDMDSSLDDLLPSSILSHGRHIVFVYDIEYGGTLLSGLGYPAVRDDISLSHGQGRYVDL